MFTWICPQCGREVPPAYTDCPDCANKAAQSGAVGSQPPAPSPVVAAPPPPPAAEYTPPPYQPPQPVYPQQPAPPQPVYPQQPYPPQPYPPQPVYPPQAYPPQPQPVLGQVNVAPYAPPPPPPARRGLPTWLLTIVFLMAFLGFGLGIIAYLRSGAASAPTATVESPAAKPGTKPNPYQRYIEISGVRFTTDAKKKPVVS